MGSQFSYVLDPAKRMELQALYDRSLTLMVISLFVISLPIMGTFWIPWAGPFVQVTLGIFSSIFSWNILTLIKRYVPLRLPLAKAQFAFALIVTAFTLVAGLIQISQLSVYNQCETDYQNQLSAYRNSCSSYNGSNGYSTCSSPYVYNTCYMYQYSAGSLIVGGILAPILELVHLILFSIACSYLWTYAEMEALRYHPKAPYMGDMPVAYAAPPGMVMPMPTPTAPVQAYGAAPGVLKTMPNGSVVIPAEQAASYLRWMADQQAQSSSSAASQAQPPADLPAYAPRDLEAQENASDQKY